MPGTNLEIFYENTSSDKPAVSVIIPAYRSSAFITKTLDTVKHQTYRSFELIIVDDGSPDDTASACAAYMRANNLAGMVIRQPNKRIAGARNTAIAHAKGAYIALLDHDDFWLPKKLERVMAAFDKNPAAGLVTHDVNIVENGKVIKHYRCGAKTKNITEHLLFKENILTPSSTVFRKEPAVKIGGFRETAEFNSVEDYDFWIRISRETEFYFLHETLSEYQLIETGASKKIDTHLGNLEKLLIEHFVLLYGNNPSPEVTNKINKRMSIVHRSWAKELIKAGRTQEAQAHIAKMNSLYRWYWKNIFITTLWLYKSAAG
ncbi:MAG: glycosyltransferase [Elusimicrobiaceae bacterium]